MIKLPNKINGLVKDKSYEIDKIGMSGSTIFIYDDMVLKITKFDDEIKQELEVRKELNSDFLIPKIIELIVENDTAFILMEKVKGKMLCDFEYLKNPKEMLKVVKQAFDILWTYDTSKIDLPSITNLKLKKARYNVENNNLHPILFEKETFAKSGFKSPKELLEYLETHIPDEDLVLSHGDLCLTNIFGINDKLTGFIDIGEMGLCDKYNDIAICYRSIKKNYNGDYNNGIAIDGYEDDMLFKSLNISNVDKEKFRYYLLLDELM